MAKKDRVNIDNTGVDKLESFLQQNIKMIIIIISALLIIFIASYLIYTANQVSKNNKIDQISVAELEIMDNATVSNYAALSNTVPALKNYVLLRSAGMYHFFNNDAEALKFLKGVDGKFQEFGAGMLYDLGDTTVNPSNYLQGSMSELWHYRNVLSSTKENIEVNINNFRNAYPNSQLLKLVENWNVN